MNDFFPAFEVGPTSERGARAVAPEVFRGIYAMPAFVTIPTTDTDASLDFWLRGLGFVELFRMPGVVHLRRWAFQDVLLVPGESDAAHPPAMSVSFSYVLSELDGVVEACEQRRPGSTRGPHDTPWLTRDVEVITPEGARVICTAPREFDPSSPEARRLADAGIPVPDPDAEGDNGLHD